MLTTKQYYTIEITSNTGPTPPYTRATPSIAKLIAEIQQIHSTINTLCTRINK